MNLKIFGGRRAGGGENCRSDVAGVGGTRCEPIMCPSAPLC